MTRLTYSKPQYLSMMLGLAVIVTQGCLLYKHAGDTAEFDQILARCVGVLMLAALPALFERAIHKRAWIIASSMALLTIGLLAFNIPAAFSRLAETGEAKVAAAATQGVGAQLIRDEYERAKDRLTQAAALVAAKCKTSMVSDNCIEAKRTETDRQTRYDTLMRAVLDSGPTKIGEPMPALVALWLGYNAEKVRFLIGLPLPIVLELAAAVLFAFGFSHRFMVAAPVAATGVFPATDVAPSAASPATVGNHPADGFDEEAAFNDLCAEVARGRHHGVVEYATRWGVHKSESSKRIAGWEADGLVVCQRSGGFKRVVRVNKLRLVKAA